jgi:hypothetical protein
LTTRLNVPPNAVIPLPFLRRTYRDGGKVRHEALANLSGLPEQTVSLIEAALKGTALVPAGQAMTVARSLPHGHVAAVHAMARQLGLPALLGPACPQRDLALALMISRVVAPASKLSALTRWDDTTLGADLGVADATTDQVYAAMHWLGARQDAIEAKLARRHLAPAANPSRMALFDLSSSWLGGVRPSSRLRRHHFPDIAKQPPGPSPGGHRLSLADGDAGCKHQSGKPTSCRKPTSCLG